MFLIPRYNVFQAIIYNSLINHYPRSERELIDIARQRRIAAGNSSFISITVDSCGSQVSVRLPLYITENPDIRV